MNCKLGLKAKVALVVMMSVSMPIAAAHAAMPGNGERLRRSDAAIQLDVEKTLRADRALTDSTIVVKSVRNGIVLLSGTASSRSDEARARRLTAHRRGVRGVLSESVVDAHAVAPALIPIPAGSSVQHGSLETEDDVIQRNVTRVLDDLDAREDDVHVRVTDGVVWLTGSVTSWQGDAERLHAARSVAGVRSVVNELRLASPNNNDERR